MIPCADGFRISSIITRLSIQGGLVIKWLHCGKTKSSWNDSSAGKHIRGIVLPQRMFRQYILEPISLIIFCSQLKYCGNCRIACKDKIATNVATYFVQNSCRGMRKIYCGPTARNYDKTSCVKFWNIRVENLLKLPEALCQTDEGCHRSMIWRTQQ